MRKKQPQKTYRARPPYHFFNGRLFKPLFYHIESFAKTRETHFSVLHFQLLHFIVHKFFVFCFVLRPSTLYYTLAITLCFTVFANDSIISKYFSWWRWCISYPRYVTFLITTLFSSHGIKQKIFSHFPFFKCIFMSNNSLTITMWHKYIFFL